MGVSIRASKPPLRRERAATTRVASTSRAILARLLRQNRHDSEAFGTENFAAALWGLAASCHSVMCESRLWRDTQSPTCTGSSHRYRGVGAPSDPEQLFQLIPSNQYRLIPS